MQMLTWLVKLLGTVVATVIGIVIALALFWGFILVWGVLLFGYDGTFMDTRTFIFWNVIIVLGLLVANVLIPDEEQPNN